MKKLLVILLLIPSVVSAAVDLTGPVAPKNDAFTCMVDDDMVCDQDTTLGNVLISNGTSYISYDMQDMADSVDALITHTATSDSTWTNHNSYPAACAANTFMTTIGDTVTCSAYTAGDYLTLTASDFDLDVEAVTDTKCLYFEDPVAADDFKSIWRNDSGKAATITKLWCESDQTVTCMLQVDDGSPADMDSVDLICVTGEDTDTSLDGDAEVADGEEIDLDIASVASTPTWASICWTFTLGD